MSTDELSVAPTESKLRVFISYSRVDGAFMEMLREALIARGYEVSIDKTDIVPGEDWRKRLEGMILKVEAVVFVISPDSVARWDAPPPSEAICAWEIRRTLELGTLERELHVCGCHNPSNTAGKSPSDTSIFAAAAAMAASSGISRTQAQSRNWRPSRRQLRKSRCLTMTSRRCLMGCGDRRHEVRDQAYILAPVAVLPHAFPHELIGAQESAPNGLGSATG